MTGFSDDIVLQLLDVQSTSVFVTSLHSVS